jgi:hypothetical protein
MSFLDNLENSLKTLESQAEASESRQREHDRRESERARSLAAAPWAEKLKSSAFTASLLKQATVAGYKLRAKVYISWLGPNLRLEARGRKLELQPTSDGIVAVFSGDRPEPLCLPVNLESDPETLVHQFLPSETQAP